MALVLLSARAVPAWRIPQTVLQPDGRAITVELTGDEWCHFYVTSDGRPVYRDKQGFFVPYSPFQLAMMQERRTIRRVQGARSNQGFRNSLGYREEQGVPGTPAGGKRHRVGARRGPSGTQRVLVILAQFSDKKFSRTDPRAAFDLQLNGENYKGNGYGSARDYFIAQSDGQFMPQFDIYGPYTAAKEMKNYGSNDEEGYDEHAGDLVAEVLKLGNKDIDYRDYDTDGDGVVDFCYVIYAGYGEAQGGGVNTIWPHQWTLADATGAALKLDGVQVNGYACSSELHGYNGSTLDGIGTICHEFGHCLGLPDFYDTSDEGNNFGMNVWSIMDYGCYNENGNTPAGYTAYEKEFLGWIDIETIDTEQELTLRPTAEGGKAYRIVTAENTDEYFLIENIQKKGWNRGAYGHGLLITHVDYKASAWTDNTVNSGDVQRMTIVPADGTCVKNVRSWGGDLYPGTSGNTEFSDYSTPASQTNQGRALSKPITGIRETDGVITCSFMKGCGDITTALSAESVTPYSFTAQWNQRPGTSEYVVEFYRIAGTWPTDEALWTTTLFNEQGELIHTAYSTGLQAAIDNLEADNLYCYRVRCRSNGVLSGYSNLIFVLTPPERGVLASPVMANPVVLGDSSFILSWSPVKGASYVVEYEATAYEPKAVVPDGLLLFSEHFDKVSTSCGDITRVLDIYTDTTDWRGVEVHAQEGCVLLGTEDKNGFLMTPVLPRTEGMVTIEFSVRRYSADDKQPIFHICLATDANSTEYVDQIGGYVPDDDFKNYYCVLGPLDTGSFITFISNSEHGSGDTPRICIDNLSFYWGDRREDETPESDAPRRITTSARQYAETADTLLTFTGMEPGNYVCRVRAVRNGVFSPYSEAHTALVGAYTFESDGMAFEIISLDHHSVALSPFADGRLYEGDITIPETVTFEGVSYTVTALADSVFRGSTRLTSVTVPPTVSYAGSKLFKGCTGLAWVDWQCEAVIDSTAFIGTAAGTLLYVLSGTEVAPSCQAIVVRDGVADEVVLYASSPFLAPRSFTARHVTYRKDFGQKNVIGRTSAWETIVVPFDVQRVEHETKGLLTPFGTSDSGGHFWLGEYKGWEFRNAAEIKANIPYIISFPASTDYAEGSRLDGTIAFSATDATIHATLDVPPVEGDIFDFVPVFRKVYRDKSRYMLNAYDESKGTTVLPGSEFQPNVQSVRTFGAYMQMKGRTAAPARLPVRFEVADTVPAHSPEAEAIYTIDGRPADASPTSLPYGIYITHGKKFIVR